MQRFAIIAGLTGAAQQETAGNEVLTASLTGSTSSRAAEKLIELKGLKRLGFLVAARRAVKLDEAREVGVEALS